jgi:hypothetical protein
MKKLLLSLMVLALAAPAQASQNVVIVFDDSGSMNTGLRSNPSVSRMDAAKTALTSVVQQLPADTKLGLVCLNGGWQPDQWLIPLAPLNRDLALQKISQLGPTGGTPLGGCMKAGADGLLALREKEHYGNYRLLIVTDGEANDSNLVEAYLPDILTRGVQVDAIGVDMASDHSLATKVHNYRRGDDPNQLQQAIAATFAETTGSGDGAAEDFAIVAALPDGAADKYLKALQEVSNAPIGERKSNPIINGDGTIQIDQNGNPVLTQTPTPGTSGILTVLKWLAIAVAAVVVLAIVVFMLANS